MLRTLFAGLTALTVEAAPPMAANRPGNKEKNPIHPISERGVARYLTAVRFSEHSALDAGHFSRGYLEAPALFPNSVWRTLRNRNLHRRGVTAFLAARVYRGGRVVVGHARSYCAIRVRRVRVQRGINF